MDIINLLKNSKNKLDFFSDPEIFKKYTFTRQEFLNIISIFLTDEEKLSLFKFPHIRALNSYVQKDILNLIQDDEIIIKLLSDEYLTKLFYSYEILKIINKLHSFNKITFLHNIDILNKLHLDNSELKTIILTLPTEDQVTLLLDVKFLTDTLKLDEYNISLLIMNIPDENVKYKLINLYNLSIYTTVNIIKTFSPEYKIKALYKFQSFPQYNLIEIIQSFDSHSLIDFLNSNISFLNKNQILPYQITYSLSSDVQKDLVNNIEQLNLDLNQKLEILASLPNDVKKEIELSNLPIEYQRPLLTTTKEYSPNIELDFNSDLNIYQGLDNLLTIMPEEYSDAEKEKLFQLIEICPNLEILNNVEEFGKTSNFIVSSSAKEYIIGEKWISDLINSIDPALSPIQKVALVDHAIGQKISYSPNFGTETFNNCDSRALWKMIASGYGVCNGIAKLEYDILNRLGINANIISSGKHTFLKLIDIELPTSNGDTIKGNTILDPTWNLASHRYNARPNNFCISYQEARENDIDINNHDFECHKNDKELMDATLSLDDQSLRKVFSSVGLTKENGDFPIKDLIDDSKNLNYIHQKNKKDNLIHQLALIPKYCPEFAKCQNSTISILNDIILDPENFDFSSCITNRVFNKNDPDKNVVIYIYIDSKEFGQVFFVPSNDGLQFTELTYEEFIQNYACFQSDLEKNNRN